LGTILESCTQVWSFGKQYNTFFFHLELTAIIAILSQTASALWPSIDPVEHNQWKFINKYMNQRQEKEWSYFPFYDWQLWQPAKKDWETEQTDRIAFRNCASEP
jgi:hypothetical protein